MVMKKVAKNVTDSLSHSIFSKYNIVYQDPKVAYLAQKCPIYVIKDKSCFVSFVINALPTCTLTNKCYSHQHYNSGYKKYTGG